jgi:outer membrane protein TolC
MRIARLDETISLTDRKLVKASSYPVVNFFAAYGFNYPNYLFFPPNPNWYSLGRVGVEASFSISNLFKNRTRVHISDKRIEEQNVTTEILKNKITDNIFRQYMQYREIEDKLPVTEKAGVQATENYRIVKLKYLNQLALITDMVDADNALLEARFNIISTRIDALMKYYELLYASGLLNP